MLRVRRGQVSWHGNAFIYLTATHKIAVPVRVTATISPKRVTGSIRLSHDHCGTVRFTAKLGASRK